MNTLGDVHHTIRAVSRAGIGQRIGSTDLDMTPLTGSASFPGLRVSLSWTHVTVTVEQDSSNVNCSRFDLSVGALLHGKWIEE